VIERHVRAPWSLPAFAMLVCTAFVGVTAVPGTSLAQAEVLQPPQPVAAEAQYVVVEGDRGSDAVRDASYTVTEPPRASAPASGIPDPGSAQAIAYDLVAAKGWSVSEYDCLVALWNRESHWNVYAYNPSSGAYGIPQALPGNKMASAGADWKTSAKTQIIWGLGYIQGRYQTPCGAWAQSERAGWY
jgi:hypothetical protein